MKAMGYEQRFQLRRLSARVRSAAARPRYPAALFDWIAALAPARHLAWDAGCGNGQATGELALRFDHVIASDSSVEQIALAPCIRGVEWRVAPAESTPLPAGAVDVAIAASAFHWFDLARFFRCYRLQCRPPAYLSPSVTAAMCFPRTLKSRF